MDSGSGALPAITGSSIPAPPAAGVALPSVMGQPSQSRFRRSIHRLLSKGAVFGTLMVAACTPRWVDFPIPKPLSAASRWIAVITKFDEAINGCERFAAAKDRDPAQHALAFTRLGDLLMAFGQSAQAIQAYRNTTVLTPDDPLTWLALGHALESAISLEDAETMFSRALRIDPTCASALVGLGRIQAGRGDFDAAERSLQVALELDRNRADALFELSRIALARGDLQAAEQRIRQARTLQPAATPLIYGMAMVRRAQGRSAEADRLLQEIPSDNRLHIPVAADDPVIVRITATRTGPRQYEQRGLRAHASGHYALATVEFRTALRLDPGRVEARYNLAVALIKGGHPDEGLAEFEEILVEHPGHVPSLLAVASEELARNNLDRAIDHLAAAVRADGGSARSHTAYGRALAAAHRLDDALRSFSAAIELDPAAIEPRTLTIAAALQTGRCELARDQFFQLREHAGSDPSIIGLAAKVGACRP